MTTVNTTLDFSHLEQLRDTAKLQRYRYLICVSGSRDWVINWIISYFKMTSPDNSLCLSEQQIAGLKTVTHDKVSSFLGHEFNTIVYDAFSGFYPNTFSILEGTLTAGGLFFLLTPELDDWAKYRDRFCDDYAMYPYTADTMDTFFLTRLVSLLRKDITVSRITEAESDYIFEAGVPQSSSENEYANPPYKSSDQHNAVEAICHSQNDHLPLVLLSRRGYGKSSAVGIAAALLVQQAKKEIIITAPRRSAALKAFEHASRTLEQSVEPCQSLLTFNESSIKFIAPDELIRDPRQISLLIIDEASALPVSMLRILLQLYSNVLLSSTVFGYEGHGRGFEVEFLKHLDQEYAGWQRLELRQPIRWNKNDPLESLSSEVFLYHTNLPAEVNAEDIDLNAVEMHEFNKQQLAIHEPLFIQLFGLLNTAHYKTSPNDVRIMMDSPFIHIFYLVHDSKVVACSLIVYEGGIPSALATKVMTGERRIKGQLLPQTLLGDVVSPDIATARFARIMRIAVVPGLQHQGIGSVFLTKLKLHHQKQVDYLGASFGADSHLIMFWEKSDFLALRLGRKPNAFTGRYPLLMCHALSEQAQDKLDNLQMNFAYKFIYLLSDTHRHLPFQLVITLITHLSNYLSVELNHDEIEEVRLFSDSHRQYDSSVAAIHRFMIYAIQKNQLNSTSTTLRSILIKKFIQKQTDKSVIQSCQLAGKADLLSLLREGIRDLLATV